MEDGEKGFRGDTAVIFLSEMACNENWIDRSEGTASPPRGQINAPPLILFIH